MESERIVPPQSIEAEMSILGGIFLENGAIDEAHQLLVPDDFYRESHRKIFMAMATLGDRNEPVDLITMSNELKARGRLEEIGGGAYLATLVDYVPMAANVGHWCRIVKQKALERRMLANALEAVRHLREGDPQEAAAKLEAALQPALDKRTKAPVGMGQSMREAVKRIENRFENQGVIQGLPYGIAALDAATSGLHAGDLVIIGGRPSMGKSALAGNILASACKSGKSALLFTLEMSRDDTVDRILAGQGIRFQAVRNGRLKEYEWSVLLKSDEELNRWRLAIDDTPAVTLREVRAKARRQKKEGLDLVVIDYLQLMSVSDPKLNRVQGLGEISRGLKQLARELEVPVVLLSQLSRKVEERTDKRPLMSDLRDSGEIEQDADVILFPYRPTVYCPQCQDQIDTERHNLKDHQAKAEIIISKQRNGVRNISVPVCWMGEYQSFAGL
ncbi:replicative DNA helicase [Geomonas silvestris]|uniref:Replicative DNA helicase n=1 Tax=Geomonas silvestris TaxID=2740184 RepID=A0A6V8MM01_9BACT|nr:replicative DNA helicase [Geomonas silvestris]GFO60954.1 replicative DNA helicase [Geomonas silvestris]